VSVAEVSDRILHTPGVWTIRECPVCVRAWLDPRPVPDDIGLLYVGAYMTHAAADEGVRSTADRIRDGFLARAYGYGPPGSAAGPSGGFRDRLFGGAVAWLPAVAGGRLLDMGCGSGAFLASMRARGWDTVGVEPDPAAREAARSRPGLAVFESVEALGDRQFDAIVLHHVIEHLPEPHRTLAMLSARLLPGGRLVMVTPNIRSLGRRVFGPAWVHWDPPRHLHLFSAPSLSAEVERAGLAVERAFTTGRYARFVGVEGLRIRGSGRVGTARAPLPTRLGGYAFQLGEHALELAAGGLGEELVVVARR
jgi:2-polyprenyl-3-methyl-5-hydroxy-6-metoxy-1,4-benzoquinol methylase